MADVKVLDVKTIIDDFTDPALPVRDLIKKMSDFYLHEVAEDSAQFESILEAEAYLDQLDEISKGLEAVARKNPESYRYFIYGLFQGQINSMILRCRKVCEKP